MSTTLFLCHFVITNKVPFNFNHEKYLDRNFVMKNKDTFLKKMRTRKIYATYDDVFIQMELFKFSHIKYFVHVSIICVCTSPVHC